MLDRVRHELSWNSTKNGRPPGKRRYSRSHDHAASNNGLTFLDEKFETIGIELDPGNLTAIKIRHRPPLIPESVIHEAVKRHWSREVAGFRPVFLEGQGTFGRTDV